MILFANLLIGIGTVLSMFISFFIFIIIARAILSWVNPDPFNPIVRFLITTSDPLIRPLRRYIRPMGGIDWTPLVVFALLYFLQIAVAQSLLDYGNSLRVRAGAVSGGR